MPDLRCIVLVVATTLLGAAAAHSGELDPSALDRGSEIAYRRALAPAASERRLNADKPTAARARRVLNQLARSAPTIDPAARHFAWAANVETGTAPHVRVFPGGRVIVRDGLFTQTAFTDEEVGAVVAHALAHALLGHDTARIRRRVGNAIGKTAGTLREYRNG